MGKRELKKIIEKRILSGEYRIVTEDCETDPREELAFVCRQLGILCESELPFYYSKTGRNILIVDHVTFDSNKEETRQPGRLSGVFLTERRVLKKPESVLKGRYKMLPPVTKGPGSAKSYLINCMLSFEQHYAQLGEYRKTLQDEGWTSCRMKTCFFIEDLTPLGSYILSADGMNELVLLYVKQFLDLFERSPDLDYVFFGCFKGCSETLWFMGRDDISCYRKKEMDLLRRNYFAFDAKKHKETI
jgi:hypothetical protein